jgi:GT2 family glycosyltransferase
LIASVISPSVHIVILNYNGAHLTLDCVESVLKMDYPNFRVLVVDNGSTDGSVVKLKENLIDPRVQLLANETNEGYAEGNNRGIEKALAAGADYVFILNNDTIVEPGSLAALVEAMERDPKVGIAGCPLFGPGTPARTVYGWRANLYIGDCAQWFDGPEKPRFGEVDCILGAAMLVRAETLRNIGSFDSRFFLHFEDFEFCLRAGRAAYKVSIVPGPGILHLAGRTTRRVKPMALFYSTRNRVWLARRHGSLRQQLVFTLYAFFYLHPRRILGRIMRGQFDLLAPVLRGIWHGHFAYPGPYSQSPESRLRTGASLQAPGPLADRAGVKSKLAPPGR